MKTYLHVKAILVNLRHGVRTAVLMRVAHEKIHAAWGQVIGLTALTVALAFLVDFVRTGPNGHLVLFGLPGVLFGVPVILFASWAVAARARQPDRILPFAVVLTSTGLVINACAPLIDWIIHHKLMPAGGSYWYTLNYYLAPGWFALASGVAAVRLFGVTARQKSAAFLLAGILVGVPLAEVYTSKTLWIRPYDEHAFEEEESNRHVLENEDVFYLQPRLLEHELASLKPGSSKGANLYFVGVAGYSEQDVFTKEVHYVGKLLKERYGTENHSVELINNTQAVADFPIASVTSLQLSLNRIGAVMDKDKDILFLYLTSHGSREHKFSLDLGGMRFNALNPFRLREILDESGIRRRVIVVSACYSGGFIDALKDDNSLVITSAAPDKTSFGCSNDADFTYFGEAYFKDALAKTNSFIDAFFLAKPLIAERESKNNYERSDPRIYVGARMQDALASLNRRQAPEARLAAMAGVDAVKTGKEEDGEFASLREQALRGNDGAQFAIGTKYQFGQGVKQDYARGAEWLQKSAAQGNTRAMCNLGWAYQYGKGVKQDYAKALFLYRNAAARGIPVAHNSLGTMYQNGEGVTQDYSQAFEHFQQSALQGNAEGQILLGYLYQTGVGVKQDDAKALEWYQKAAAQGNAQGYNSIGYMLLERRERIPEAVGYLEKAIQLAPNNSAIMDSLGWGYYLSGKQAEAIKLLQQAYAGFRSPVIAAHLGEALWAGGQKQAGEKIWHEALKVHPHDETLRAVIRKFTS